MPAAKPKLDVDAVREMASRGMTDEEIGVALGAHRVRVHKTRSRNGIAPGCPLGCSRRAEIMKSIARKWRKSDDLKPEEIRAMAESGMTDPQIAAKLKRHIATIHRFRMTHGIPPAYNTNNLPLAEKLKRAVALLGRQDKTVLARKLNRAKRNARYGLPPEMATKEVKILLALCDGPMDMEQLKEKMGLRSKYRSQAFGTSSPGVRGTALSNLCRNGWVFQIPSSGKKGGLAVYMLTSKTIDAFLLAGGINE